jgi:hypothetical protein
MTAPCIIKVIKSIVNKGKECKVYSKNRIHTAMANKSRLLSGEIRTTLRQTVENRQSRRGSRWQAVANTQQRR